MELWKRSDPIGFCTLQRKFNECYVEALSQGDGCASVSLNFASHWLSAKVKLQEVLPFSDVGVLLLMLLPVSFK